MSKEIPSSPRRQGQFTDDFLYYFLRVRKQRVQKVVKRLLQEHPGESREQLARRLITAKTKLSYIAGTLTHLPMVIPGIGSLLKYAGVVGGTSVMTRMHLALVLEIALLYGKDLDDEDRVSEMAAVVAAVGMGTAAPFLVRVLELNPLYALPTAAISACTVTQLVGDSAIKLYRNAEPETV